MAARTNTDKEYKKATAPFAFIPAPILQHIMTFAGWFAGTLGLDLAPLSIKAEKLGHVILSNVGTLGIEKGFAPLVPAMPTSFISSLNAIKLRACVNQKTGELEVRECMSVVTVLDHRFFDGAIAFKISTATKDFYENPESFDINKY